MQTWLNDLLVDKNKKYPSSFTKDNYTLVKIDSRKIEENDIFIAFQGENINSHVFLPDISNKVSLFFYDKKGLSLLSREQLSKVDFSKGVEVTDSSLVLPKLCLGIVKDYIHKDNVKICAITGSVGKTTTRSMIVTFLSHLNPLTPQGNFNNEIGIPLTILRYKSGQHKCVVLEFGARHLDDISYLCSISEPDITSCINVYSSHLQEFKTVGNIYEAKTKIFNPAKFISTLGDDLILKDYATKSKQQCYFFGSSTDNDITLLDNKMIKSEDCISSQINIRLFGKSTTFSLPCYHSSYGIDLVAALSVALRVEPNIDILKQNISSYRGAGSRFEIIKTPSYTVVNDCYNASFESISVALKSFLNIFGKENVIILGDMLELGDKSRDLHLNLAPYIKECEPTCFICIGENMNDLYLKLKDEVSFKLMHFSSVDELDYPGLKSLIQNKAVLIKASNSMKFSTIVKNLV